MAEAGKTVVVLGGGVGGLSAAHELAERGFRVRVFERKALFGGKARSLEAPNTGTGGPQKPAWRAWLSLLPQLLQARDRHHETDPFPRKCVRGL